MSEGGLLRVGCMCVYRKGLGPFDTLYATPYTRHMDPLQSPTNPPIFAWNRPTGEKTKVTAVRLFKSQFGILESLYKGNISALIRYLLDQYLSGKLPELKLEFERQLNSTLHQEP